MRNAAKLTDDDNPMTYPRPTDVGECKPAAYTQALAINRNAGRAKAIDDELRRIDAYLGVSAVRGVVGVVTGPHSRRTSRACGTATTR